MIRTLVAAIASAAEQGSRRDPRWIHAPLRYRQPTEHDIDRLYELLAAAAREITRLTTPQHRRLPEENQVDLGYAALSGSTRGELIGRDYSG